jgi:hypothetical protein
MTKTQEKLFLVLLGFIGGTAVSSIALIIVGVISAFLLIFLAKLLILSIPVAASLIAFGSIITPIAILFTVIIMTASYIFSPTKSPNSDYEVVEPHKDMFITPKLRKYNSLHSGSSNGIRTPPLSFGKDPNVIPPIQNLSQARILSVDKRDSDELAGSLKHDF